MSNLDYGSLSTIFVFFRANFHNLLSRLKVFQLVFPSWFANFKIKPRELSFSSPLFYFFPSNSNKTFLNEETHFHVTLS